MNIDKYSKRYLSAKMNNLAKFKIDKTSVTCHYYRKRHVTTDGRAIQNF